MQDSVAELSRFISCNVWTCLEICICANTNILGREQFWDIPNQQWLFFTVFIDFTQKLVVGIGPDCVLSRATNAQILGSQTRNVGKIASRHDIGTQKAQRLRIRRFSHHGARCDVLQRRSPADMSCADGIPAEKSQRSRSPRCEIEENQQMQTQGDPARSKQWPSSLDMYSAQTDSSRGRNHRGRSRRMSTTCRTFKSVYQAMGELGHLGFRTVGCMRP